MASILVMVNIFILNLIAFALAVAAEQRRNSAKVLQDTEKNYTYCAYESDIATGYGVGALLFLLLSQILTMGVSKCLCFGRSLKHGGSRSCAIILFLLLWLTFLIAEACLLAGSVRNAYHTRFVIYGDPINCSTVRKGIFASGAAFTFFTAILSEFYYFSYSKAAENNTYGGDSGVNMSAYR